MFRSRIIYYLVLFLCFTSCKGQNAAFDFSERQLMISSNGDKASAEAADYLFKHLSKRAEEASSQFLRADQVAAKFSGSKVYMEVVPDLKHDYEIRNEAHQLSMFGKSKETLQWLSYMLISHLAEYRKLTVDDLPPNYVDFNGGKFTFAMKYREPHLLPNVDEEQAGVLYTHSIDRMWGIWGHNLSLAFPEGISEQSQALVNGKRSKVQFCFSSAQTFKAIKDFVVDQYGREVSTRFMIAPQDNDISCTCSLCLKQGNTVKDASGAMNSLLNRLAEEFPKHYFFLTAYRTTVNAPKVKMRENTGVYVSTIDLPKTSRLDAENKEVVAFSSLVKSWKEKSDHVYLWDYISNFDDYLTPYPVLKRVQAQISFFSKLQIEGLFLNGSGYDYSPFDDVKTYVLSAIMINPYLSVDHLVKKFHQRFYPVSGSLLSAYLLEVENSVFSKNLDAGIYTPFLAGSEQYHNQKKFSQFYHELDQLRSKMQGVEKEKVDKLITALSYTYLQDLYFQRDNFKESLQKREGEKRSSLTINGALKKLDRYQGFEHLLKYKEEDGYLKTYCAEWEQVLKRETSTNKLSEVKVSILKSGELIANSGLLKDNVAGFVSDFNQGWFLSGDDIKAECLTENSGLTTQKIILRFLINPRHRMAIPQRVDIFSGSVKIGGFSSKDFLIEKNRATLESSIKVGANEKVEIIIYKNKEINNSVIACDEIHLL